MSDNDCTHDTDVAGLLAAANGLLMGASQGQILISYYETLNEFFVGSNSWLEPIGVMVVPNILDYHVNPLSGRTLWLWAATDQNNVPQAAVMPQPGLVHFLYPYTVPQPVTVTVTKSVCPPFRDGRPVPPDVPEWLFPAYHNGILDGLVGRMMLETGQSYTDQRMGTMRMGRFRDAISMARVMTMRMNTVGGQAWAYPQQFRVTGQRGGVSTFNVNPSPMTLR
jgi:hypothetical protein